MVDPIYRKQGPLMNSNEMELYRVLKQAVGSKYLIVPQVHMEKLIRPKQWIGRLKYAVGHVSRWSVDFALFDLETYLPLLAIELNGETHNNLKAKAHDNEKTRHLEESGIPLLVFLNNKLPSVDELTLEISRKMSI